MAARAGEAKLAKDSLEKARTLEALWYEQREALLEEAEALRQELELYEKGDASSKLGGSRWRKRARRARGGGGVGVAAGGRGRPASAPRSCSWRWLPRWPRRRQSRRRSTLSNGSGSARRRWTRRRSRPSRSGTCRRRTTRRWRREEAAGAPPARRRSQAMPRASPFICTVRAGLWRRGTVRQKLRHSRRRRRCGRSAW